MKKRDDWIFSYEGYNPEQEGLREALLTVGNGFFASRAASLESDADEVHYPGTYLAGGYNRLETEVSGRTIENEDLVNLPNYLPIRFRIGDEGWFQLDLVEIEKYTQEIHLKTGVYHRKMQVRDAKGNVSLIEEQRFIHMKEKHLAAIEWKLTPINWSGPLELLFALDGRVKNEGVDRYKELNNDHLNPVDSYAFNGDCIFLEVETMQSKQRIAEAAKTTVFLSGEAVKNPHHISQEPGYISQGMVVSAKKGETVTVEKIVSLYTSRDDAISECSLEAKEAVLNAKGFNDLLHSHSKTWKMLWGEFGIDLEVEEGVEEINTQLILRLHIFHLLQTTSPNVIDLDVGVPARGLHGEAYRGHIFWDELFIFPTLNLRLPKVTAALLKYRARRLKMAKRLAEESGFRGAMYPWQSGSNGREESQTVHLNPKSGRWVPDHSNLQRHVSLAVAYNFFRYFDMTGDFEFFRTVSAEVVIEIARFWASIASYNEKEGRFEIEGVMGPDEYHDAYPGASTPGLKNNAYTNVMASWLFHRVIEMLKMLPDDHHREIRDLLSIDDEEIALWHQLSRKLKIPFQGNGVVSQFEGFDQLKEFPWDAYRKKYGDIHRLDRILEAEGKSANEYQVSKQADFLMIFYLFSKEEIKEIFTRLGYPLSEHFIEKNIDYYLRRTAHGSTLSQIVHAWVLSLVDRKKSWDLFQSALKSDVADVQGGTTKEGIHLGAMAGTVDLIQRCYLGIEARGGVLWFNPQLPNEIQSLKFHVHYRGHSLQVELTQEELSLFTKHSLAPKIHVGMGEMVIEMVAGEVITFPLKNKLATQ